MQFSVIHIDNKIHVIANHYPDVFNIVFIIIFSKNSAIKLPKLVINYA